MSSCALGRPAKHCGTSIGLERGSGQDAAAVWRTDEPRASGGLDDARQTWIQPDNPTTPAVFWQDTGISAAQHESFTLHSMRHPAAPEASSNLLVDEDTPIENLAYNYYWSDLSCN